MVAVRNVDCGEIYEAERGKFVALLKSCTPDELAANVPATPAWSVRDVLAHLVGITADLNAQDFGDGGDADAWTAAQVSSRRGRSIDEIATEWDREAPLFEEGLRLFGYELGSHYVGDLLQHVGDVRHALGLSQPPDDVSLAVALDFYLVSFEETLTSNGLGGVDVSVGPEQWTLGTGPIIASVSADRYELFRSLGGRRTEEQIRSMEWSGDATAIIPAVSRYPLPPAPIVETR